MATKNRSASKKRQNSTAKNNSARRQLLSVIWFAVAVFLLCVVFIKGQNLWLWLHNAIFGIFGVIAFVIPFLIGFVTVMYALDKTKGVTGAKIIGCCVLIFLIAVAVDIFTLPHTEKLNYGEQLIMGYDYGVSLKSGGFVGALLGELIVLAFGKTGAAITVILLIFVLLMLITGTTLTGLFKGVSKPVKNIKERAEEVYAEARENGDKQLKIIKGFNPDIPVDDTPKTRKKKTEDLSQKQAKVVSTYYDEPMPSEILAAPEGEEDKKELDHALKTAEEEAEKIDFKAETKEFTETV